MTQAPAWLPYCGPGPAPGDWLGRWNLDPWLLAALLAVAAAWLVLEGRRARAPQRLWGAAAGGLLVLAFISPLCALTSALFSARVVHHALLVSVTAPLIVMALSERRRGPPPGLATATAVQALVFWVWHAPAAYGWALSHDGAYWLMQLSLLGSAMIFWAGVLRASAPAAVAALLATMVQMGLLGALITFAGQPLFVPHLTTTAAWGLTPLADQQLAGLIMWAPAAGVYLLSALVLLGRWLGAESVAGAPAR